MLLSLLIGPLSRLDRSLAQLLVFRIPHGLNLLPSPLQVLFKALLPPKTMTCGIGPDFGSIMGDPFHLDQAFGTEQSQHLDEDLIQLILIANSKIRQRMMIHRFPRA